MYRKKVQRSAAALNDPRDQAEAVEAIRDLIEKISLRHGPDRGEIDATLHGELGMILQWIGAQAVGPHKKTDIPAASAAGMSVSMVAGARNPVCPNFAHPLILTAFSEVKDAHQLTIQLGLDLPALGAGLEDGIADQAADCFGRGRAAVRIIQRLREGRDLGAVDVGCWRRWDARLAGRRAPPLGGALVPPLINTGEVRRRLSYLEAFSEDSA